MPWFAVTWTVVVRADDEGAAMKTAQFATEYGVNKGTWLVEPLPPKVEGDEK